MVIDQKYHSRYNLYVLLINKITIKIMFKFGGERSKLKKDVKGPNLDLALEEEIAKTKQHGDESQKPKNLRKEEGKMFGNPYGENAYNLPGHKDEERLKGKDRGGLYQDFVPIQDVVDKDAENAIYEQADATKELEEEYDNETEFMRKALKILDPREFKRLFSFFKKLDDTDTRKDYIGTKDEHGTFVPPISRTPTDITDLIKKVNTSYESDKLDEKGHKIIKTQRRFAHSAEYEYDDNGELIGVEKKKTPVDQIKFKVKGFEKKENKNAA